MRIKKYIPGRNISEKNISEIVNKIAEQHGKDSCIDIGSGDSEKSHLRQADLIQTVDMRKEFKPDYLIDVRSLFVEDFKCAEDYSMVDIIPSNNYMLVQLQHIIEHIEWIHQEHLFQWVMDILAPSGMVSIATPNLEYIVGVYVTNRKRQLKGEDVKYPIDEHRWLTKGVASDMQRWVNFKTMSGCSPGDYHHCCYDRLWLYEILQNTGFERISIYDGGTLKVIAYKPGMKQFSVNEAVRRATDK